VKAPSFQGLDDAIGFVRHAGVDNDVMMASREQRAGGPPPTAGKQDFSFP